MLRISLHQFRCWEDLSIEIPIGAITLLKGNSGVGKTTILQAITWGLYGNIRLVAPNHMENTANKAKTRVIIELPYTLNNIRDTLTITRQKNPNRLLLSHTGLRVENDQSTYEDKVAQALIDDMFGTYDIWMASCYIGQRCRNNFLTAPNTGKMELLNSIAFHEEDPTSYIERIDTAITETDVDYKMKLVNFTNNLNSFQSLLSTTDINKTLTSDQIITINAQLLKLTDEKNKLQRVKTQRDIDIGILSKLREQLTQTCSIVIKFPDLDINLITMNNKYGNGPLESSDQINSIIDSIMNIIPIMQRRDDLISEVKRIEQITPNLHVKDNVSYTMNDYQNAISKETIYRDNQRSAQSLGVRYNEMDIKEAIRSNQHILASQDRLKLEYDRNNLQSRISNMEQEYIQQMTPLMFPDITPEYIPVPDYSKYNTEALSLELTELSKTHGAVQAHIQHLQKGHDVLQCPHCKNPVRYQQGILTPADTGPTNRDDISLAQQQLSKVKEDIAKINRSIQSLNAAEISVRSNYERSVMFEQKRIDSLREKVRLLELEKQRREMSNQARASQIKDHKDQLEVLNKSINSLQQSSTGDNRSVRMLTNKEVEQMHILIGRLSGIIMTDLPLVSSQTIQSHLNQQDMIQKHTMAMANYMKHLETIHDLFKNESVRSVQDYIDKLRAHWNKIKASADEIVRIDRLKISLNDQIRTLSERVPDDPTYNIEGISCEILSHQQLLELSTRAQQAIRYHNQITQERDVVVGINNTLADLQVLRQHAVETECRILQQVVDSINSSIQGVCGTMFDRDISISLNLFKMLKTTKNVKPVANFTISYQGGTFDNINQMSGGEGDRASLALTLALNRLSSCPLLMLDESLESLDTNMKEAVIRTIRENTNNTVLIILHDGTEGIFDNVINMDEIRETMPLA